MFETLASVNQYIVPNEIVDTLKTLILITVVGEAMFDSVWFVSTKFFKRQNNDTQLFNSKKLNARPLLNQLEPLKITLVN